MSRECPCCSGGERPWCPDCGGNDEHPPQHCQDCSQLDAVATWSLYTGPLGVGRGKHYQGEVKGCTHCGFTGWADEPAYGGWVGACPKCGELPDKKKLRRGPSPGVILDR